jgi:NADH-ubiquinone oxidoreductase chain 2
MFFDLHSYKWNYNIFKSSNFKYNIHNLPISNSLSITISILTLIIILFMFIPDQWLHLCNILSIIVFTPFA